MLTAQRLMLQTALRRHATSPASTIAFTPRVCQQNVTPLSTLALRKPSSTMALARRSPLWMRPRSANTVASSAKAGVSPATPSSSPSSLSSSAANAAKTSAERRQEMVAKGKSSLGKLKELWQQFGMVAVATYFSMYGVVLSSIYVAIERGWVSTAKTMPPKDGEEEEKNPDFNLVNATNKVVTLAENLGIAKYLELEHVNSKTGSFVIAWVATKFTEPLRLALTLAITPRIARLVGRAPKIVKMPKA